MTTVPTLWKQRESVSTEVRVGLYRAMSEGRRFEKRVYDLFLHGLVKGTSHLAIGMEATGAGFAAAMREDDLTFCTYRGHLHTLYRGAPMAALLAELLGRKGICGGKGGSMHLTDTSRGAMGSYAIVGAHLPIAAGTAWASTLDGSDRVTVCFFGDGATNIGAFHEALNLAAVWRLPVVFVCENNQYMEYTPIGSVTAVEHPAAGRAASYGLDAILVDGNDVEAVHDLARHALHSARHGAGPVLVESLTYRHGGHSRADPGDYRPDEEVAAWLARDPIPHQRERLLALGVTAEALDRIDAEADRKVDEATEAAKATPYPDPDEVLGQLWADGGSAWRSS